MRNTSLVPLTISRTKFVGPDADRFSFGAAMSMRLDFGSSSPITLRCTPTRVGSLHAQLNIYSNDPDANPFVLDLSGTGTFKLDATKAGVAGSALTYGPLATDPYTGVVLQKVTFANPTGVALNGLRLVLANVAAGITVYSSSAGDVAGTLEVIYSKPIAAGETVQFTLTFFDPKRRTSSAMQPSIYAEALQEVEPRSGPVTGTLSPILSVRDTVNGPLLDWMIRPNAVYVVEYSDDAGVNWFSAVHRLSTRGTRMFWVDRGQPETFTKPVNKAARSYRVKRL